VPGIGLRRRKECLSGRRRPTIGRRPLEAEFIRRAPRQASAFADAKSAFPVGAGRPLAGGLWRPNSFGAQAGRRPKAPRGRIHSTPKAFTPIEIGLLRRLRARRRPSPTQRALFRSAQADRWPEASGGRIHSARRPAVGRRPPRSNSFDAQGEASQGRRRGYGGWCRGAFLRRSRLPGSEELLTIRSQPADPGAGP
jgi:hypothetical protein